MGNKNQMPEFESNIQRKIMLAASAMPESESNIQRKIMLAASAIGDTVWRNNTGAAWQGEDMRMRGRDVLLINARPVRFGLCVGSSDIIGIRRVIVTPEMVGQAIGRFLAFEVKGPGGRASVKQRRFNDHVNQMGGLARVVRKLEDIWP